MLDYGSFFRRERRFLGLSQIELARGICSAKTISRIETGRQIPSPAQFSMLIERLGVSGFSYADFFDTGSIRQRELKEHIITDLDCGKLEDLPQNLCDFREGISGNKWEEQFFDFAMGWFCYQHDNDHELFLKKCKAALEKTGVHACSNDNSQRFLLENECRIYNQVGILMYELGDAEGSVAVFNRLISNQTMGKSVSDSYRRIQAVLCNNAAVSEKELFPEMAKRHIKMAEDAVIMSGNSLMEIRIRRTRIKLNGPDITPQSRSLDAVMLKETFRVVNGVFNCYEDFWSFLSEPYLIHII